jgi:sialic acid synthase SpsE
MIILDFGSGSTCQNNVDITKRMIDELKAVDTRKHTLIIKWQLFIHAGENLLLNHTIFDIAYEYAAKQGYKTTASVFDQSSLHFLLKYDVPFVKIANRRDIYWLYDEIPVGMALVSGDNRDMCCISKYPATVEDYEANYSADSLRHGISDHTTNFTLFHKYNPEIYECHYKLEDSIGLDAGDFARTPEQLSEVL